MGNEAAGHAQMLNLKELVERYAALAGKFGEPVMLSAFDLTEDETRNFFAALDEDYHISRFLHFSHENGKSYRISGEETTHIAIDPGIYSLF